MNALQRAGRCSPKNASAPGCARAAPSLQTCRASQAREYDVVLSSGFLAFANHSGFLAAVDEAGIKVSGVMGTSAGALAGSLYAAGYSPGEVAEHLRRTPPIKMLKPSWEPWRGGVLSLEAVVARLSLLLPATFEELQRDFAVGVVTSEGEHVLIDSGPLPEAVAASAAIPFVFSSVDVPGGYSSLRDGGVVDRIGLKAWRNRRRRQQQARGGGGGGGSHHQHHQKHAAAGGGAGVRGARPPPCLVHIIERSSPFSGSDDPAATGESEVHVVRSPKSGVNFFDLGDFDHQFAAARARARPLLEQLRVTPQPPQGVLGSAKAMNSGGGGSGGGGGGVTLGSGGGGYVAPGAAPLRPNLANRGPGLVVARRSGGPIGGSAVVRATPEDGPGPGGAAGGSS